MMVLGSHPIDPTRCCFCCYILYDSECSGRVQAWWNLSCISEAQDRHRHARASQIRRSTFTVIPLKLTTCHCQLIFAKMVSFFGVIFHTGWKEGGVRWYTHTWLFILLYVCCILIIMYKYMLVLYYYSGVLKADKFSKTAAISSSSCNSNHFFYF